MNTHTKTQLLFDEYPQFFLDEVSTKLGQESSIHSFLLSLTSRYIQSSKPMSLLARLVDQDGHLIAAGIQTEMDRVLIISNCTESAAIHFADLLSKKLIELPGVNGPAPAVDAFAKRWTNLRDATATISTNLRLFELTSLSQPKQPSGSARVASFKDRTIIFEWLRAFRTEAVPHDPIPSDEDLFKSIDAGTAEKQFFVWEDQGNIVCLVGSRRETPTESWIAPVYTPHELRGRGYGAALTAFVSERILASGKKGMLFTDLANPVSNGIYQKIGYKPVADFKHFTITSAV